MDRVYMTVGAGDGRGRRLAAQRVPHAGPRAVLRRHVLPAARARRPARPARAAAARARRVARAARRDRGGRPRACSGGGLARRARGASRRPHEALARECARVARAHARRGERRLRRRAQVPLAREPLVPASAGGRASRAARGAGARHGAAPSSTRCARAASTTTWAAASTATRPTASGSCRTSRRCSTTRRCSRTRYLDGFEATRRRARTRETARGVVRVPAARPAPGPRAASTSAEDADSEGEEGRFYVWTPAQLAAVLAQQDARRLAAHYGVTPQGNFEHGASVLHERTARAGTARRSGSDEARARRRGSHARPGGAARARARAPCAPHRDDKVLAAWNGLTIAALRARRARAGRARAGRRAAARAARVRRGTHCAIRRHGRAAPPLARGRGGGRGPARRLRLRRARPARAVRDHARRRAGSSARWRSPRRRSRASGTSADGAFFESPAGDAQRARAHEGRLRRRRAGGQLDRGREPASGSPRCYEREDWRVLVGPRARLLCAPARRGRLGDAADAGGDGPGGAPGAPRRDRGRATRPGARALLAVSRARFRPFDDLRGGGRRLARAARAPAHRSRRRLRPVDGRATGVRVRGPRLPAAGDGAGGVRGAAGRPRVATRKRWVRGDLELENA